MSNSAEHTLRSHVFRSGIRIDYIPFQKEKSERSMVVEHDDVEQDDVEQVDVEQVDVHTPSNTPSNTPYSIFVTIPSVFDHKRTSEIMSKLRAMDDWKSGERLGLPIQRLQKWYHDDGSYFSPHWITQSHERWKSNVPESWINDLRGEIQQQLVRLFDTELCELWPFASPSPSLRCPILNSTLINYYRDGTDFIKFHTDDEQIFGNDPTIAMLAFGSERPLLFRPNYESDPHLSFSTKEGDLFVMLGAVQKQFTHGIQRDPAIVDPRFSITFREHRC
jgi:hypothetical protein